MAIHACTEHLSDPLSGQLLSDGDPLLVITAKGRYGMPHCRLMHHGIEGGKAGRVGLISRSSSQFHRLAQLLLGPVDMLPGTSGALVLTAGAMPCLWDCWTADFRIA